MNANQTRAIAKAKLITHALRKAGQLEISARGQALLSILIAESWPEKNASTNWSTTMSFAQMQRRLSCSKQSIRRALEELQDNELIVRICHRNHAVSRYIIMDPKPLIRDLGGTTGAPGGVPQAHPRGVPQVDPWTSNKKISRHERMKKAVEKGPSRAPANTPLSQLFIHLDNELERRTGTTNAPPQTEAHRAQSRPTHPYYEPPNKPTHQQAPAGDSSPVMPS